MGHPHEGGHTWDAPAEHSVGHISKTLIVRYDSLICLHFVGRKKRPTGSGTLALKPEILEEVFYRVHEAIHRAGTFQ